MNAVIRTLFQPEDMRAALPALAALRIEVFREWPYLYDGSEAYEAEYLAEFMSGQGAVLVVAEVDGAIVGAATASPLCGQASEVRTPFEQRGMDTSRLFYFGESVLRSACRGLGIGHGFFDAREAAARAAGAIAATFCAVIRPLDHPLRPVDARDLHPFWRARGYAPVDGLQCTFDWKDVDQSLETDHPMQFWMRQL